tara:strand:- start:729 stop:1757 length:1029 start_codon:yes stop_codon:yes gene_type:complete
MTNYEDFTFGVEVEFTGAQLRDVETGMRQHLATTNIDVVREGYNHITRPHWKITTDATVTEGRNYATGDGFGGELVSPVLRGADGFAELDRVLEALNSVSGVTVDYRCSVHVHLKWDGMTTHHVKNIVSRYRNFETSIDAWIAPSRRANKNRWCCSINQSAYPLRRILNYTGSVVGIARLAGRYHKVNLQSLSRYGTVEFRHHGGSTCPEKITNWVKFLMGFCEASKRATLGQTVDLNYRASKQKVYSQMREQFAMFGYEMKWARGHNWDLFDPQGNHVSRKVIAELDAMYTGRSLNQTFLDWWNSTVNQALPVDDLFNDVEESVKQFLQARVEHFAQRRAA